MTSFELIRKLNNPIKKEGRHNFNITHVQKGGFIKKNNILYYIEKVSKYLETKWSNFEKKKHDYFVIELTLINVKDNSKCYIEYEFDDELEIYETINILKMSDITFYGEKLKKEAIEFIADEEEGVIRYNNTPFFYSEDDTWAAKYFPDNNKDYSIPVRLFEFYSDNLDEDIFLTIEIWYDSEESSNGEKKAFISKKIDPSSIEIIQLQ